MDSALHKAEKRAKGKASAEVAALQAAHAALESETPLRDAKLDPEVVAELRGIAPLTLKPEVVVANLEEGTEVPPPLAGAGAVGVFASIEAETAEMDADEARALLEEFGVEEPGLEKVIAACYRALDLITFLTTGEDETRAWEVRRGAHRAGGRRRDPHGPAARVHPRRGHRLRRAGRRGIDGGREGRTARSAWRARTTSSARATSSTCGSRSSGCDT